MRLHPAVATALVLVGGALLYLPISAWLRVDAAHSLVSDTPSLMFGASIMSGVLGLAFISFAVIFSMGSQSDSGGST